MLPYILALAIALGSLGIYLVAFFFPEIHRKNDFIWSGLGLFYALVLWVCAGRITGGVLLGQVASVALLGWSVTQTLSLRRELTPRQQQTELPSAETVKNTVQGKISNLSLSERFAQLGKRVTGSATSAKDRLAQIKTDAKSDVTTPATPSAPESAFSPPQANVDSKVEVIENRNSIPEQSAAQTAEIEPALTEEEAIALAVETTLAEATTEENQQDVVPEAIRPHPPNPELVEDAVHDAEEKDLEVSPPETETTENP